MEILSIKNEVASLFVMGKLGGNEEIKIICDDSCVIQKKNGSLYRFEKYNLLLFNKDKNTEIIIDNNKVSPLYVIAESGLAFYEFEFDKSGEKSLKIITDGKDFATVTFDVCAESPLYKSYFNEIKNQICKAAEGEAYLFLKDLCKKYNIRYKENVFLTFEGFCEMFFSRLNRCCGAEKRSKRNFLIFRRKWSVAKKESLKKSFDALLKLMDKFIPFCPELCGLKNELEEKLFKSPLSAVEIKSESDSDEKLWLLNKSCVFSGDFLKLKAGDIEALYGFYCYTAIVRALSENYNTVEKQIFKTDESRYALSVCESRKSSFVNMSNDNVITVFYNIKGNASEITVKVSLKENDASYRRLYILKPFYKQEASENEVNQIYRYICENNNMYGVKVYGICLNNSADFECIREINPCNNKGLNEWVLNIAGDGEALEYQTYENFAGPFTKDEFDKRNVCVAVVKTKEQFNINIKEKFYYIPSKYIENIDDVEYIALYQSKTLFKDKSGIRYFGRVEKASIVERYKISEIPANSDELYCRFDVKEWHLLKEDIQIKDFAEVCMMTSLPLLKSVKSFPELYMNSFLEYILYKADENARFSYKGALFKCDKAFVTVYFKDGQTLKFSKNAMKQGVIKTQAILDELFDTPYKKEEDQ